jgi:serine/threonine protein kinase
VEQDETAPLPNGEAIVLGPTQVGTYTIVRLIGKGAMGVVYEALQSQPQRRVAIKLIRSDRLSSELVRRFALEIQALGRLRHPHIARIYEGGATVTESGPNPYFVMEFVDGIPIDEYVARQRVGIRTCVALIAEISDAVHHAHQQDVIHRDLKPANILVEDTGQPKILDFGVARVLAADHVSSVDYTHTQVGVLIGTLPYMSPEQTEADPEYFDQRSDVYALGVIAYKLLVGRLPYTFSGGFIEARAIIHDVKPKKLSELDRRLAGDLEQVIERALAKERSARYQTAKAFADDLRCVLDGRTTSLGSVNTAATIRRLMMREGNIRQAGWAGVIGYGVLSFFMFFYLSIGIASWVGSLSRPGWLPVVPTDKGWSEFMLNLAGWSLVLVSLASINWRVKQGNVASMWIAFACSVLLSLFTASVLFGLYNYQFGGALRDPVLRVALYVTYTPLALLAAAVSGIALVSAYCLNQWMQPVIPPI